MEISDLASHSVSKAILVTGSARSGTTIMGKIIHSLNGVECSFEPPMMFSLFALINKLTKEDWTLLYETYLYEEFLLNTLAGRAINCNKKDDSSIYNVKSAEEIEARLGKSLSKAQAEDVAEKYVVSFKMPDVVPFLPKLLEYYPSTRVVVMLRGATETLDSLIKKKWFSEENCRSALIWPFRKYGDINIPFWVKEGDDELWSELSELDRSAYYYIRVNENVNEIRGRVEVKYSDLLAEPYKVVEDLADTIGVSFGLKTRSIIEEISPTTHERDKSIADRVSCEFKDKVKYYSDYSS